jgi:hypothetical protein
MQSSPFHTNKIFDGKFSMLNVPKTTKNSSWRLVKDVDDKTGSFVYKLVNNEVDSKVVETKNNLMKETEKNTAKFENQKTVVTKEKVVEEKQKESIVPVKHEIQNFGNSVMEYNIENNCILSFDFESFTAKTRNVIMSPFSNECIRVNSKDFQKLSENSRFLDYKKDFLTRINHVIFSIEGTCTDSFSDINITVSLKFLNRGNNENTVYNYNTSKLLIKNNNGKLFQQFVGNVDSFIPSSNVNLITYTPTIQIHNENESQAGYNLFLKTILKFEKVNLNSVNTEEITYLPLDSLNYK